MTQLAPIALFAFKRPRHLAATLDALVRCPEFAASEVTVFCDGPRGAGDQDGVRAVRDLLRARRTPNTTLVEREANRGLANSIIGAVGEITERAGRVIVIEDDLVLQPTALAWLNQGLDAFSTAEAVMQIGAYQYRIPEFARRPTGTFQRFATTWGWGTWRRAWTNFDPTAAGWEDVRDRPEVRAAFDAGGVYPFSDMLEKQMAGKLDSWGIRWSWSVFRQGGVSLMPPRSLVSNEGFDDTATHNSVGRLKGLVSGPSPLLWDGAQPPGLPGAVAVDPQEEAAFRRGLLRTNARRNARIKAALAAMGVKRFAS